MAPQDLELTGRLSLDEGAVAPAILQAFSRVVAYARSRASAPNVAPPVLAHEYRKSFRRARSLLRMLEPSIPRKAYRSISLALREAHRHYAGRRDGDAAREAWRVFSASYHFRIPEADAFFSRTVEVGGREAPSRREVDEALELLAAKLPGEINSDDLRRGLEKTYRSARDALRKTRHVADPAHVHRLRRRCKDLHNQLELLESIGGAPARKWRKRFSRIAKQLGEITDLYLVRDGLDALWLETPGLDPVLKRNLDRALDSEIAGRVAAACKRADKSLGQKAKKFSARFDL